jgi:hypothetical protein
VIVLTLAGNDSAKGMLGRFSVSDRVILLLHPTTVYRYLLLLLRQTEDKFIHLKDSARF